ncbi:hypothetical protein [Streptomyces chattanoogensis]|uniref:hypothetical protein n=1 Tax=Streptomyces chattanoogensis TaxID=66876 RepID=UPI0005D87A97|nr:hypothetical protein T261_5755 [Streptomyces lydicus]
MSEELRMRDIGKTLNDIEGYLLWEAEKEQARTRADAFCDALPWLTDTQRREVELRYCQEQHATTRDYLERIAARSASLRAEYDGAYRALRRRMVAACLGGVAAAAMLVALAAVGAAVR